ncbi:hypothetical protein ACQKMD_20760 [Viridibacillus sp. NPDC096237]|uniref:hypothetical protein n=1 Tax=Viridibacillus sp. NPDC096237 TaxID=3390721 RepID=UPI003D062603
MNPVVGLDVAKGESQVQMFLDKKMPYKNSVKIEHTERNATHFSQRFIKAFSSV